MTHTPVPNLETVPPVVQGWIRQLLDPSILEMMTTHPNQQIEIRIYAHNGKVRKAPMIVLNGGAMDNVSPEMI